MALLNKVHGERNHNPPHLPLFHSPLPFESPPLKIFKRAGKKDSSHGKFSVS